MDHDQSDARHHVQPTTHQETREGAKGFQIIDVEKPRIADRLLCLWSENSFFAKRFYIFVVPALLLLYVASKIRTIDLGTQGHALRVSLIIACASTVVALFSKVLFLRHRRGAFRLLLSILVFVSTIAYIAVETSGAFGIREARTRTEDLVNEILCGRLIHPSHIDTERYGRYSKVLRHNLQLEWERVEMVLDHIEAFSSLDLATVAMIGSDASPEFCSEAEKRMNLAVVYSAILRESFKKNPGPIISQWLPFRQDQRLSIRQEVLSRSAQRLRMTNQVLEAEGNIIDETRAWRQKVVKGKRRTLERAHDAIDNLLENSWRRRCQTLLDTIDNRGAVRAHRASERALVNETDTAD